ncbi:MAG: hypothetical protein HZC28_09145 [Spirochaetes bacterium]|nr:hypothetical protein [Spirochaetota bacterium]
MKSISSMLLRYIVLAVILCAASMPVYAKAKGTNAVTPATDGTASETPVQTAGKKSGKTAKPEKGNTDTAKLKEGDTGYTLGALSNINAASGTLQIDERVFKLATNCVISVSGKKEGATLADFKKGDKIEMRYVVVNGVLSVTALSSKASSDGGKKKKSAGTDDADSAVKKKKSKE